MLERVVITIAIVAGLGLLWLTWQYYKAKLVQRIRPDGISTGKPTLLYFTGEYCTSCKLQQTPIIEKVRSKLGNSVAIKTYDVSHFPDIASRYKVLTLPTTVVLNEQGQVKAINYGVTQQHKLEAQLL